MRRWTRGSYNTWIVILGVNGCGKTTRAKAIAHSHARQGVRVFVHDPDGQYSPWPLYPSPEAWRAAEDSARQARRPFPTVARFSEGPMAVIRLAQESAERSGFTIPSLIVLDEGSVLFGKGRREAIGEELVQLTTRRRNRMVGVLLTYQWATMLHYLVLANATEIHVMRVEDKRQVRYLTELMPDPVPLLGDPPSVGREAFLQRVPILRRGEAFTVRKGF